ncbi:uncharacterized protein LOC124682380 [Lolium rigidum]|uniref:uncharacterized protein LOC124682380 n=1 Tax=Lolium rigidum TaxID=89674 RepID=UPI001F5CDCAF|nr:uncharacterized protein LOC124682380 [Lolium rigidum]
MVDAIHSNHRDHASFPPENPHREPLQTLASPFHIPPPPQAIFSRPLFFLTQWRKHHSDHHGAAAADHPAPVRDHQKLRLVAPALLVQGIEPAFSQSTANSPIPLSGHHAPARFPTASDLVRLRRGVHQFPGEMAPLFPLFPVLFARCLASPKSDGFVAVLTEVLAGVSSNVLPILAAVRIAGQWDGTAMTTCASSSTPASPPVLELFPFANDLSWHFLLPG